MDHFNFLERALETPYEAFYLRWQPGPTWAVRRHGAGVISALLRFRHPTGLVIFDVHAYLAPDGNIGAGRLLDPKTLILGEDVILAAVPADT